jgi:DNA repair and recombination protein RAD54B
MWNKPFKPPLLKQVPKPAVKDDSFEPISPPRPAKKRCVINIVDDSPPACRTLPTNSPAVNAPRKPLLTVTNLVAAAQAAVPPSDGPEGYYLILWYVSYYSLTAHDSR